MGIISNVLFFFIAISDLKTRSINVFVLGAYALVQIIDLISGAGNFHECLPAFTRAIAITVFWLAVCLLSDGSLGPGDVFFLGAFALGVSLYSHIFTVITACLYMVIMSFSRFVIIRMGRLKKACSPEAPFIPFLLLGYVSDYLLQIL